MRCHTLLLALLPLAPADLTVFRGAPGAPGDVQVLDTVQGGPPVVPNGLGGVRLLDLECHGRSHLERFLRGGTWRHSLAPGVARLELPRDQGSLYRFARDDSDGLTRFGFFVVTPDGEARHVWERGGVGPAGGSDPFRPVVSLGPGGEGLLVATVPAAGGDLIEIDLVGGTAVSRTAGLPPLDFRSGGVVLSATWGLGIADGALLRFDRASSADATPVPFVGASPAWFPGDVALSPDGTRAVVVAGADPLNERAWVLGSGGPAVAASATATAIAGAGFLPQAENGPHIAVSNDGSRAAWRTEPSTSSPAPEAWIGRPQPAAIAPEHVTNDGLYLDTLDEIGQFLFRGPELLFAVGESDVDGMEAGEFYRGSLDAAGALSVTNLTLTNGSTNGPFFSPASLQPRLATWLPASGGAIFFQNEFSGGDGELCSAGPSIAGMQLVLASVKEFYGARPTTGGDLVALVQRSGGGDPMEVHSLATVFAPSTAPPLLSFTEEPRRWTIRPDGRTAFVENLPSTQRLHVVDPATGLTRSTSVRPTFGSFGFLPTGELALGLGQLGGPAIFAALPVIGAPTRLDIGTQPGFVLPGL